jgi:DNA-binding NarL/FixJ family response regulator
MAKPAPSAAAPEDVGKPESTIVLLVDDTPDNLAMLLDVLGRDYKVLVAESGESALEQLQYVQPNIILLDVLMSGMDGFDTFRQVRRLPEFMDTPVLFLSGVDDIDHKLRGLHLGAVDYITKPFHPEEVLARVESQLRVHSRGRHLQSINQDLDAELSLQKQPVSSRSPEALLVLGLTPREAEVLFWIAEGKTSPEIALILDAAPTTIKKHVNHILEKLALENRLSAALLAKEILRSAA